MNHCWNRLRDALCARRLRSSIRLPAASNLTSRSHSLFCAFISFYLWKVFLISGRYNCGDVFFSGRFICNLFRAYQRDLQPRAECVRQKGQSPGT